MKADLSPSEGRKSSILTEPGMIRCRMERSDGAMLVVPAVWWIKPRLLLHLNDLVVPVVVVD